jgi:thiol-disulfide isomerase/thioredoxin
MTGLWALLGTLVVVGALGALLRVREGRIKAAKAEPSPLPGPVRELLDPASPVTLVQLSTTFCAPCRHARALLTDLAGRTDGLHHVELDITDLPEVASELGVLRTPTTLALAPSGTELLRVGGVPKRDTLLAALRPHLPASNGTASNG